MFTRSTVAPSRQPAVDTKALACRLDLCEDDCPCRRTASSCQLFSEAMAGEITRGGAKRKPVADVDNEDLFKVFEEHVEAVGASKALFLARYAFIARSHAVDAAGLAESHPLMTKALMNCDSHVFEIYKNQFVLLFHG